MSNPINISGKQFEYLTEQALQISGHSFKKTRNIDYEIILDNKVIGLECKGQKGEGTTDEKLTFSIYKYCNTYDEIIMLLHPLYKFRTPRQKKLKESMEWVAKYKKVKLTFIWGIENLSNYLSSEDIESKEKNITKFF
tara:strand:+ start:58 stop:471 length:414 start_codon:yes stop_codon:yes gene_type:complete